MPVPNPKDFPDRLHLCVAMVYLRVTEIVLVVVIFLPFKELDL